MNRGDFTEILLGPQPIQVCPPLGPDEVITFYNADIKNVVRVSRKSNGAPSIPIQPLTSANIPADTALYGFAPDNTTPMVILPGSGNMSPSPAQIAEQINSAGIPPTDDPVSLNNSPVFNQTIAAGATYTSPRMTTSQFQSWFGKFFATATAAGLGANPYTQWEMNWSVASDNFDPLRTEDWIVPNTPFNFTYNYINQGQGFGIGDTLTLSVTNLDTQPVNLTYGLFGSYRTRVRSSWRGNYFFVVDPAFGLGTDNIVSLVSTTVGGGSSSTPQLMNLWEGPVTISGGASNPVTILIQPASASGGIPAYEIPVTVTPLQPTTLILPRRVCNISINNTGVNNAICAFAVTGQVQPE